MPDGEEHWTFDKRIPLAFVLAFGIQTAGIVWWAASLQARVSQNQQEIERMRKNNNRLTRVEANQVHILAGLAEIKRKLDGK